MSRSKCAVLAAVCLCAFGACGRPLSAGEADRLISANPKAKGLAPIATEAVSTLSSAEAVTKTAIMGQVLNLKFRRYDTGWRWEFAETKAGGWIAADEALSTLHEQERGKRATTWASEHADQYQQTVSTIDDYSGDLPRLPGAPLTVSTWSKQRHELAALLMRVIAEAPDSADARVKESRAHTARAAAGDPEVDAWGHEILLSFDDSKRQAVFVSLGPDGKKGTNDDVLCLVSGVKGWDSDRRELMWNYTKQWVVPEGLQAALDAAIKEPANRKADFSKVVE